MSAPESENLQPAPDQSSLPSPAEPPPSVPRVKRRRPGLIAVTLLSLMLLLCGGGGTAAFALVQDAQPRGTNAAGDAVEGFLNAVFVNHDAKGVARFVCADVRDEQELAKLVFEVRTFQGKYESPRTTWTYPPPRPGDAREVTVPVVLTMSTANDQVASKEIRLLLVEARGWWVCDVETPGG